MDPTDDRTDPCDCAGSILAVDDCPATLEILRASLEHIGYRVHAVDSGWAALDAVSEAPFDAIVLDVEMPGMDGMAVGRTLRSTPHTASAPIAMHSSLAEAEVRAHFDAYDIYLPKGGDLRALGARIDHLVRSRRGAGPAGPKPAGAERPPASD